MTILAVPGRAPAFSRLVLILIACLWLHLTHARADDPVMIAHYVDVGQGACTLLEFPCGAVLIDTGGDGQKHVDSLVTYLTQFFARRPDLNNTLAAVFTTHPHIDHTRGLRAVAENFTITNYIDNGYVTGSGRANPIWIRKEAAARKINIRPVTEEQILELPPGAGLSDKAIDPISCNKCDPKITVLSSGYQENPGWSVQDFKNQNNQSVVIRVDFGQSSFLFTGDLEETGIEDLLERFHETTQLDVDVYMVGHHGSYNATTDDFLSAITPEIAVMGTGRWDDGKSPLNRFSTYAYGHPRTVVVKLLADHISGARPPKEAMVADAAKKFKPVKLTKKIYATGWDGTIDIKATLDGKFTITTSN